MAAIGKDLLLAKKLLDEGQVIGIPTETVYGLAGNALDQEAVVKIFEVKNRPSFDPLIVHIPSQDDLARYVTQVSEKMQLLINTFSPGPVSFLLQKKEIIPDIVSSGLPRVAIRIPAHPLFQALLSSLEYPLAAPSANPFGYISPTKAQHVDDQLGEKIPYILDGGPCQVGLESTIIGEENGEIVIYRKGGLAIELIEQYVGKVRVNEHSDSNPAAPGMLKSHYAPVSPIELYDASVVYTDKCGFLRFEHSLSNISTENQYILSKKGNISEAAKNLFEALRWLDQQKFDKIIIEFVPSSGLGLAINDRLTRALAPKV